MRRILDVVRFVAVPQRSEPIDLIQDRAELDKSGAVFIRSLPLVTAAGAALFVLKVLFTFHADLSITFAVLERIALAQAILYVTVWIALLLGAYFLINVVQIIVDRYQSSIRRRLAGAAIILAVIALPRLFPVWYLIVLLLMYVILNILAKRSAHRLGDPRTEVVSLDRWAELNVTNPDVKLRAFARDALDSPDVSQDLVDEILDRIDRVEQAKSFRTPARIVFMSAVAWFNLFVVTTMPLSGTYVVDFDDGPRVGYVIGSAEDAMFISKDINYISLITQESYASRKLCLGHRGDHWLLRPVGSLDGPVPDECR